MTLRDAPVAYPGATRATWYVAAGFGAAFAVLTALVASGSLWPAGWDHAASNAFRRLGDAHETWITTMRIVTLGGDGRLLLPLNAGLAAVCLWRRRWRSAALFTSVIVLVAPARLGISILVDRVRPSDGFVTATGWAYPSGHTTWATCTSIACAAALWPHLRNRAARSLVVAAAFVWSALVALSRVALLAHWPSDVVGAALFSAMAMAALLNTTRFLPVP